MCSFFGAGEKIEAKIEELVKKFEDRFADIEDKVSDEFTSQKMSFYTYKFHVHRGQAQIEI